MMRGPVSSSNSGVIFMRMISLTFGVLVALAATEASAQSVNLTGMYKCVQMCRSGLVGYADSLQIVGWYPVEGSFTIVKRCPQSLDRSWDVRLSSGPIQTRWFSPEQLKSCRS